MRCMRFCVTLLQLSQLTSAPLAACTQKAAVVPGTEGLPMASAEVRREACLLLHVLTRLSASNMLVF